MRLIPLVCLLFFFSFIFISLLFSRHHAQVFRVKTVQSAFPITVKINITVTALQDTMEDIAKQVRGLITSRSFFPLNEQMR